LSAKIVDQRRGERRHLQWVQRLGTGKGSVQVRYEFFATVDVPRPSASMNHLHKVLHAAPRPGEEISPGPGIDPSDAAITRLALELTSGLERVPDQVRALFHHVADKIHKEPGLGGSGMSAGECLAEGRGDALAKGRLLVALCRNRGIPARLVTGLL